MTVYCYLFTDIPGSGKNWTLAVFAISKLDAVQYVKRADGGGKFIGEVPPGKVDASCGAITESATLAIRSQKER